jgi:hypothetical protein
MDSAKCGDTDSLNKDVSLACTAFEKLRMVCLMCSGESSVGSDCTFDAEKQSANVRRSSGAVLGFIFLRAHFCRAKVRKNSELTNFMLFRQNKILPKLTKFCQFQIFLYLCKKTPKYYEKNTNLQPCNCSVEQLWREKTN